MNLHPALIREIQNRKFEIAHNGLYLPRSHALVAGVFGSRVKRGSSFTPWSWSDNIIVNQGLDHILDVILHAATQVTTWYIAPFEGNYTPVATDTAANITANSTESTAYDESTRVEYVEAAASSQSITNAASVAVFTINDTKTMFGAFLVSASAKSATTGSLLAASRFATSRAVIAADVLQVTYTLTAADA